MHNTRCFLFLYYRLVSRKKFSIWMTLLRKVSSKTSRAFSLCCTVAAVSSSKNGSLQKSSTARPYPLVASAQARAQKVYRFSHQAGLFSFLDSRKNGLKRTQPGLHTVPQKAVKRPDREAQAPDNTATRYAAGFPGNFAAYKAATAWQRCS